MPRKKYHHGELRTALIQAAIQAIEKRGQVEFNLRELAEHCGVSVAALYRHFASKNHLLIALADIGFSQLRTVFLQVMDDPHIPAEQKRPMLGLCYVRFAIENEGLFRVMFYRELCQLPEFSSIASLAEDSLRLLQEALGSLRPEPLDCSTDLPTPVLASWSQVHGLAFLWLERNIQGTQSDFLEQVKQILEVK